MEPIRHSEVTNRLPVTVVNPISNDQVSVLPPALSSSFDTNNLLKALRRRWLLAATLGLFFGGIAAAAGWFLLPPGKFTAESRLHVEPVTPTVLATNNVSSSEFLNFQKTQSAEVKSRMLVLNAALRDPEVAALITITEQEEPIDWLERELQVDFKLAPEILRIALSGYRPEDLKKIVNKVTKTYLNEIANREVRAKQTRLDQLTKVSDQFEKNLSRERKNLKNLKANLGSGDPQVLALIQRMAQEQVDITNKELMEVRSKLRKLEIENPGVLTRPKLGRVAASTIGFAGSASAVAAVIPSAMDFSAPVVEANGFPDPMAQEQIKKEPGVQKLVQEKEKLETDYRRAVQVSADGERSSYVQQLKKKITLKQEEIDALCQDLRAVVAKQMNDKLRESSKSNRAQLQNQWGFLINLENALNHELTEYTRQANETKKNVLDVEALRDDLSNLEEMAKKVSNQVESLRVELQAPSRISPLDDAFVTHPDETKRRIMVAITAGGLVLGVILFVIGWSESRFRRIYSSNEVVRGLGIKLMGTVPALPSQRQLRQLNSSVSSNSRWQALLTESVDTARTMLLHAARTESIGIVMVTSAMGGEGKTSLSSHLATSLARAGRKTLLLDCDLRNPAAHRLFDAPKTPGICELLRGEVEVSDAILHTPVQGLWMIPGGQCDGQAIQALARDGFQDISERLRPDFDFIIVDSAPVLPVADSLLIAPYVDAVIFSIMNDVSQLHKVYAAQQRLEILGVRLLGAVVNGTVEESYGSNYRYATT
jgi:capsular exopolysaccharide synthesis family protein